MLERILKSLTAVACLAVCCGSLAAQTQRTITIRMIDGATGKLLSSANLLIRINHQKAPHADWVHTNEDDTATVTLPPDATVITPEATYHDTMETYVNCDAVKDKQSSGAHWYPVADILSMGVAAPNGCGKKTAVPKPGEFIFFVRHKNWQDSMKQDYTE
jgi:hypothetical protein